MMYQKDSKVKKGSNKKLFITNERMLLWKDYSIQEGKALNQKQWCELVGFPETNMRQIRSGVQSFTVVQILAAAQLIDGNINWLFGISEEMIMDDPERNPLETMKALLFHMQRVEKHTLRPVSKKVTKAKKLRQ